MVEHQEAVPVRREKKRRREEDPATSRGGIASTWICCMI
jgi:hypothetical protein